MEKLEAIMEAGKTRFRPVILTAITTILGATISFGVVYNSMRIALSERNRELASLRVLGFERGEVDWRVRYDPVLQQLADDPGFQALLQRIDEMIDGLRRELGMPPADL